MLMLLAALACLLGALLQFAVYRSPDIVDRRRSVKNARRITIAALVVAGLYLLFADNPPTVAGLILGLLGMGQMLYAYHNLDLDKLNLDLHLGTDT